MSRVSSHDAEAMYSAIESAVWAGATWDEIRKTAAECYEVAMRRHADDEIKKAREAVR